MGRLAKGLLAAALWLTVIGPTAVASAAGGPQWSETELQGMAGDLFLLNVSCPSESLCVATGTQNLIASSTHPTGGASAWKVVYAGEGPYESTSGVPVISNRQIQGVSCPSENLCVAVTLLGQIYSTTDPTGPASAWNVAELPSTGGNTHLYAVSCPTAGFCAAVSGRRVNKGKVFTSTDPTGGADAWRETDLGETYDLRAVSCSSPDPCVAAGANGELLASGDPAGGPSAWTSLGAPGGPGALQAISCVSGLCLTGNTGGNLLTSSNPFDAGSWSERNDGSSVQVTGASCVSASLCLAADNNGHVFASTDPSGGASAWTSVNLEPYSPGAEQFNSESANALFGASCPTAKLCAVVGSQGRIFTSTNAFAPPALPGHPQGASRSPKRGPKRPRVTIAHLDLPRLRVVKEHRGRGRVRFYANGPVRRFECKLDHHRFRRCRSPKAFPVHMGTHALRIRAIGLTGLRGPITAQRFFAGKKCLGNQCLVGTFELPIRKHG